MADHEGLSSASSMCGRANDLRYIRFADADMRMVAILLHDPHPPYRSMDFIQGSTSMEILLITKATRPSHSGPMEKHIGH
ncbi:hypothetical protein VTK73DRAFT_2232 [Phialemonium thermophilum]|uniref:Uncharacterized protein n=1 Tax=Phialemonium thermophilum TaxID=223376 RepID=A0ABR3X619_9PEZI